METVTFALKNNFHRVIGIIILLIGVIFGLTYGLMRYNDNKQKIVASYVAGSNYLAQKDSVLALRYFQYVYNKSSGMLEMLALMNIIDILIEDKQYAEVFDIMADALSQKQNPELAIMLYSKMINAIYLLREQKFDAGKLKELAENIQKKTETLRVSEAFSPHKNTIILELNGMTNLRPKEYYASRINRKQTANEMQNILLEIHNHQ